MNIRAVYTALVFKLEVIMKKIISMTVTILLLLMVAASVSYADDSSFVTASAFVNNVNKLVTIKGNISSGSGQQVTVLVVNPSGGTDYIDQTTSGADGSYEFSYILDEDVGGVYTVTVGGTGVTKPASITFTYAPVPGDTGDEPDKDEVYIEVSASVNNITKLVTISGNISSGPGQQVTVLVVNPSGGTDYIDQTTSGENGSYKFTYTLDEKVGGVYTVTVGGTGVTNPASTTFTYKPHKGGSGSSGGTVPVSDDEAGEINVNKPVLNTETGEAVTSVTENAVAQAFANVIPDDSGAKIVTVNISAVEDANAYVLQIPVKVLSSDNFNEMIKIVTETGTITLPANMLVNSEVPDAEIIELVISRADTSGLTEDVKEKIGDRPVVDIYFRINGVAMPWSNPYMPLEISIPYSSPENEDSEKIAIWYIEDDGSIVPVYSGRYNSSTETVTFTTTHLSKYAVAYVDITFEDISNYGWAKREIEVLASKGIIKGTSTTRMIFSPSANITRADYAALLVRTLGLTAEVSSNFDDVTMGDYFYEEVGIAKALGIIKGIGNNKFAPREEITRQDMMTMTARALKALNKLEAEGTAADLDKFTDAGQIASYAVESVAALVKDGLIVGSDNRLNPEEKAIRAEVAVLMYRIYNK